MGLFSFGKACKRGAVSTRNGGRHQVQLVKFGDPPVAYYGCCIEFIECIVVYVPLWAARGDIVARTICRTRAPSRSI